MFKTNRLIALCDVLGFTVFLNEPICEVYEYYIKLMKTVQEKAQGYQPEIQNGKVQFGKYPIDYSIFSDTILLWTDDNESKIKEFLNSVRSLITASVEMHHPLRAGFAFGESIIIKEENVYLGKAIADAYKIQESQNWIGGAFHNSCLECSSFKNHTTKELKQFITTYDIPLNDKPKAHEDLPINWGFNWMFNFNDKDQALNWIQNERDKFKAQGKKIWEKYNNTLKFIDYYYSIL